MPRKLFGEVVREMLGVTDEHLDRAAQKGKQAGRPIGEVLVEMGIITEKQRIQALGYQWDIPFIDLQEQPPGEEASEWVPLSLCEKHTLVPVEKSGNLLRVAMAKPLDVFAIDELQKETGFEIEPLIAAEDDIRKTIERIYGTDTDVSAALSELIQDATDQEIEVGERAKEEEASTAELVIQAEEPPVVRIVNMIIVQALREGASDIHVQPEADRVRVRYRVDGLMVDSMTVPKKIQNSVISRIKIMADMDIAEKRAPQDGRISLRLDRRAFDLRVSTLPNVHGEKVVMRILDKSNINVGLEKLGLEPSVRKQLENLITRPYGIFLVTGPTGSGKSTTLYSILNRLNTGESNIITLEDPVEYELPGLTQSQVDEPRVTFATGLRTILRQDPDIIMVGEIRDAETALIATEAALTGHLVLSTLHTNDAPGAITRLIDMDVEPFLVASAVIGVEAQRLVRVICERCKVPYQPPPGMVERLGLNPNGREDLVFYRGEGCDYCRHKGTRGRIGCFELMTVTERIRDLILKREATHVIRQAAIEEGMPTLRDDAIRKVLAGITTLEEALRVIYVN